MSLDGFDTVARLLSEAILNGLWQGMALTAIVWLTMRLAPRTSAATRYAIWSATLAVVLALPFVHLANASPDAPAPGNATVPIHLSASWPILLLAAWAMV